MKKSYLAILLLYFLSNSSYANFTCAGKVDEVTVRHSGGVSIVSGEIWISSSVGRDICSIEEEWNGISIETCRGWLSIVLAAKASGTDIHIIYTNNDYSCESMPTWKNAINPHGVSSR